MKKGLKRAVVILMTVIMLMSLLAVPALAYDHNDTLVSGHTYNLLTALNRNKALDVPGNNAWPEDGAPNIQIWDSNWTDAQSFTIEKCEGKSGWYKIVHATSGKVLDVEGASDASGTNVILWPWNGGWNQLWTFERTDNNGYRIKNGLGNYLDVQNASKGNGTNVWVYASNRSDAQIWYLEDVYTVNARRLNSNNLATTNTVWLQKGKTTTVTIQFRGYISSSIPNPEIYRILGYNNNSIAHDGLSAEWVQESLSYSKLADGYLVFTAQLKLIATSEWKYSRDFGVIIVAEGTDAFGFKVHVW